MLGKKHYANGQKVYELSGDTLTYFYRNGRIRAEGLYVNNLMEGEWKIYRQTGQLWVVCNYVKGNKCGSNIRYDRLDNIDNDENIEKETIVKY